MCRLVLLLYGWKIGADLTPETFEEVREIVVCDWEEFERRARARFGEDGFFTIIELMLTEYPPDERVRLAPIAG